MNVYEYKGYMGSAEIDTTSGVLVGKLLFIRDSIAYSAETAKALEDAFHQAVDEYLGVCQQQGDEPDVPCKGSFNVRIEPDLHRRAALAARAHGVTLNQFVGQALQVACSAKVEHHTHLTVHVERELPTRIASAGLAAAKWERPYGNGPH